MIVAGTGHRPGKLNGYSSKAFNVLVDIASKWLEENKPTKVISGMAMGWDMALAQATINKNIPLICALPFKGQEKMWSKDIQALYNDLISKAQKIVYVSPEGYTPKKMQKRNQWMVDHADVILAMWDGTMGGTYNCIKYAENKQKSIINLYNTWKLIK